ncbi:MAG: Gfo/Idh/MocA family oxidoreductase [Pyrinomonadaceae bacterium]
MSGVHLRSGATQAELFGVAEENRNSSANSAVVSDVRGHRKIIEDFLGAIKHNARPLCDGREGRRSLALIDAIYRSARTGQPIELSDRGE